MPRSTYVDRRYAIERYYDSAGNELDGRNGQIVDWRKMRKEIERLNGILDKLKEVSNIKQVRAIMEEL